MCLEGKKKPVEIKKKIGYVFVLKDKLIGNYRPYFALPVGVRYELGERWKATHYGRPVSKSSDEGGFFFFKSKRAMKKVLFSGRLEESNEISTYRVVGLKCEFEEVFEKGKWLGSTAYRAMYRTILEEVS